MKIKKIKYKILLISIFILFVNLPLFLFTIEMKEDVSPQLIGNPTEKNGEVSPKLSYTATIPYDSYIYAWNGVYINDDLFWEFWNFAFTKIHVYAMDAANFAIFDSGGIASGWLLSDGTHTSDSGTWSPPNSDTWYIVYHHSDESHPNPVTLTCNTYFPIEVTTPTDPDSWQEGTAHIILWDYRPCSSSLVTIDLYRYGIYVRSALLLSSTSNDGSYSWTVPSGLTYGSGYQIKVADYYYPASHGFSEAYFSITAPDSLTITYPTGSSSWEAGVSYQIQWSSTGSISNVDIDLYRLGSWVRDITDGTSDDGAHYWMIPTDLTHYDDTYQIHIEDSSNPSTYDNSPAYFEITPPDSITVTGPIGGSVWLRGTSLEITWTTTGSIGSIDIDIMKDITLIDQVIGTSNDGTYYWPIPGGASVGDDWWVILYDNANAATYDLSADFSIVAGTITVTSPTSSDSWEAGSMQTITWGSTGSVTNVGIELYHSGSYYDTITSSTADDGSYSWTLDSSYTFYDDNYQIVIFNEPYTGIYDYSDAYFEITSPSIEDSITVTGPTAGSVWLRGTDLAITWTTTGTISLIDIEIMKDLTLMDSIIETANDGAYNWFIPIDALLGDDWWVILYDNGNPTTYDLSLDFEIADTAPLDSITVTGPIGGSTWVNGTDLAITWTTTGTISLIDIVILKGLDIQDIILGTANDGAYNWPIPIDAPLGTDWWLALYDNASISTNDTSLYFEVADTAPVESITLTSPIGGESWAAGTTHAITWTWTGIFSSVEIRLYSGATLVDTLASNDPNDGSYSWTIPTTIVAGTQYWIAIIQVGGAEVADMSGDFTITSSIARYITITRPTESSSWLVGTTEIIRWTWTGGIASVDILMTKGTGESATIEYEFYDVTNTGEFSWAIPGDAEVGDDWSLIIYDHLDALLYDLLIGFEIRTEGGGGDTPKPLIPGYNLLFLAISLLGMILISRRKWIKKLVRT